MIFKFEYRKNILFVLNFVQAKSDIFDQYEKHMKKTTDYLKYRERQKNIHLNPIDFHETSGVDLTSTHTFKIVYLL